MAGALGKYSDDLIRVFRSADEVADVRAVLQNMSSEINTVLRSSDPGAVDDLIRRGIDSGDEQVARVFGNDAFKTTLNRSRQRNVFQTEFETAMQGRGPVDVQQLMTKHGLTAEDPMVKAAQDIVTARGARGASQTAEGLSQRERDMLRHQQTFNFSAGAYARLRNFAENAGVMRKPLLITAEGYRYATSSIGLIGTAAVGAYVAHASTGGASTEWLAQASYSSIEASADVVRNVSPELADAMMKMAPEVGDLALAFISAPIEMAEIYVQEANRRYNLGMDETKIRMTSQALSGHWVGAALESQGIHIGREEISRVIHDAEAAPDKKAYIIGEISRLSGRGREEIDRIIGQSPNVVDTRNMTAEQIAEMERQIRDGETVTAGAPVVAAGTSTADAIRRRVQQGRDAARDLVGQASDHAQELNRLRSLSGEGLTAKFNEVVDQKGLNMWNTPTLMLVGLLDFLGNPFGWGDALKRNIVISETVSQFGDRFNVLRQNNPQLNLDSAPAPAG
ncbi:MAG: hypothetical protein KJ017_13345 [Alphaproteobacteria bacterium]|nr:hypothetical protein [Alphaproteobacteria bacterium]